MSSHKPKSGAPSQRQLKVGEELRHIIADIFMQGMIHHPELESTSITVTQVVPSADLKFASVYVLPLGGGDKEFIQSILNLLNELSPQVRHLMAKKITFKSLPKLTFREDESFSYGRHIEDLLTRTRNSE